MSKSTPADLAVAFRSLVRRRDEAVERPRGRRWAPCSPNSTGTSPPRRRVVGSAPDPTPSPMRSPRGPLDDWDDATLDELRRLATDAGTVVAASPTPAPAD